MRETTGAFYGLSSRCAGRPGLPAAVPRGCTAETQGRARFLFLCTRGYQTSPRGLQMEPEESTMVAGILKTLALSPGLPNDRTAPLEPPGSEGLLNHQRYLDVFGLFLLHFISQVFVLFRIQIPAGFIWNFY